MSERKLRAFVLASLTVFALPSFALGQQPVTEALKDMLAAQIRSQGFACDKSLSASRDAKRSRPDQGVWVLTCSNASYRVSRVPDMAAKVEPLR